MKHILFPTDFSLDAQNAFLYAVNIAEKINAEITLLHVAREVPAIIKAPFSEEIPEWVAAGAYEKCFKLMQDVLPPGMDRPSGIKTRIEYGPTVEIISEVANTINADFIIAGTRGASGFKEVFLGSNISRLMEQTEHSVIAIPDEADFQEIKTIVFPFDFMDVPEQAISKVLDFAQLLQAELWCFHVNVAHNPLLSLKMEQLANQFGSSTVHFEMVEDSFIPQGIMNYAHQKNAEMLAIVTHKYSYIKRLINLSYGEQMVLHADKPILTVK